jgi:hypothetical protein
MKSNCALIVISSVLEMLVYRSIFDTAGILAHSKTIVRVRGKVVMEKKINSTTTLHYILKSCHVLF